MEDVTDADLKRERPASYGHAPPATHRMPPSESPVSHDYPLPPPNPGMPHPWNSAPSPYEAGERRAQLSHQPPYHPHSYPTPGHEQPPRYGPEHAYSRPGSISAPTRSPADPPPPQYHPVNGNGPEGPYYPPHGSQEYRPQHSYGPPPETPTNGTQQQQQQPGLQLVTNSEMMSGQPSGPTSGQYGPQSAGPPQTPYPYYGEVYGPAGQRRKPVRAAQACDSCRQRKAKCDEGRPECLHCKENGLKCTYREIPPQKQEKQVIAINEKLEGLERQMMEDSQRTEQMLRSLEDKFNRTNDLLQVLLPSDQKADFQAQKREPTANSTAPLKREASQPMGSQSANDDQGATDPDLVPYSSNNKEKLALPADHTTAAQNLLSWPSIKALIPDDHNESYVMDMESQRGLLRLYGCGEGDDPNDGKNGPPASPAGSASSSSQVDDDFSTPSPGGVWGSGQIPPPSPGQGSSTRDHPGGVSPQGGLILESEVVDRYFKSYMENMHILHPFLESRVVRDMVTLFKKRYSWDYRLTQKIPATIGKRKREADSPSSVHDIPTVQRHHGRHPQAPVNIEHSIANAIVLLIIALGKVCSHKTSLPGAPSPSAMPTSTPQNTYSDLPMSVSAPTSPFNQGTSKSAVPPMAVSGPSNPQGKNMDVIPGLAYFAKAADILGELPGGTDVSHVQANLLAGLYMGQLARIFASHYYISNACKACMVLIESRQYRSKKLPLPQRNIINFAFWSCLQLESDILAEVELPPSGVTRFEHAMLEEMPTGITLEAQGSIEMRQKDILRFYSYQVQLRRTLNEIHTELYKRNLSARRRTFTIIDILDKNLEAWRSCLGDWNWDDNDHMSPDINVARMRGKYYGAKYIIFRWALYQALQHPDILSSSNRLSESPGAQGFHPQLQSPSVQHAQGMQRSGTGGSEMGPPSKFSAPLDPKYIEAAETCVAAAIRSTTAFDGVPGRLIITNIFGTAHAQFGNLVVLAATYASANPSLRRLISEAKLLELLDRTINFLKRSEDISPVLRYDAYLLQIIKTKLFGPSSTASSFSTR